MLEAPRLAAISRGGQFVQVRPTLGPDPLLPRPFSVYRVDPLENPERIEVFYQAIGRGTHLMEDWVAGDETIVFGPLGRPFEADPAAPRANIWVAGGVGIAPFLLLAQDVFRSNGPMPTLLVGARNADDLAFLDDFSGLGVPTRVATDDGSRGARGFVTRLLAEMLQENRDRGIASRVLCCGPTPMMRAVATMCEKAGAECRLSLETPMACGYGVCNACVVPVETMDGTRTYVKTCIDGPALNAQGLKFEEAGTYH